MEFGFEGLESADFDVELEDVEVKRVKRFERLWRIGSGGSISYTKVKDGVAYFGSMDRNFYAVDVEDGKEVWRFRTGGVITGRAEVSGNTVFFTSFDQNCYALDKTTGKEIWRFRAQAEMYEGPVYDKGILILGTKDGYVHAIDAGTGKGLWTTKTGDDILSVATVHENMVFVGSVDSNFYCLDLANGRELWRFRTGDLTHNDFAYPIVGNMIFFTSFDSNVYCVDYRTGKEIWRFKTGKYGIAAPPLYHEGVLYQGTRDGILYAISLQGKEIWRYKTGGLLTRPIAAGNRLYFGSEDGYFRCLDTDGNEIWRFRIDGVMWDIPSYWNGKIVFGTWQCRLHVLDAGTGEEIWRYMTSDRTPAPLQPAYQSFSTEIKKQTHFGEAMEGKYRSKKKGETVSLSDYHVSSEYATTSEYKQKSDYDVSFVIFEGVLKTEEISWTSDLKASSRLIST